tara:strand:- start:295 stop:714 length:420 start_codon:yes stop_codon:yes gene_type:complete
MEDSRKKSIENLRLAIKASLLIAPMHEYRVWACKWLEEPVPTPYPELLKEMAKDSIVELAMFNPRSHLGRARQCWYAVETLEVALDRFNVGDYGNCDNYCLDAAKTFYSVASQSMSLLVDNVRALEMNVYGETFTPKPY